VKIDDISNSMKFELVILLNEIENKIKNILKFRSPVFLAVTIIVSSSSSSSSLV